MSEEKPVSVSMSSYRWHTLLHELSEHMRICNRYQGDTITLYEEIATALNNGSPVRVIHEQNPNPQYRPKKVTLDMPPAEELNESKSGKPRWLELRKLRQKFQWFRK